MTDKLDLQIDTKLFTQWLEKCQKVVHLPIDALPVQSLIDEHYDHLNKVFKRLYGDEFEKISYRGFLSLVETVMTNDETIEKYENQAKGMATHIHKSMVYFAETKL